MPSPPPQGENFQLYQNIMGPVTQTKQMKGLWSIKMISLHMKGAWEPLPRPKWRQQLMGLKASRKIRDSLEP